METPKIAYRFNIFTDLIEPKGFLKRDRAFHACWYYFMLAHKAKVTAGDSILDQIIYEGNSWMDKNYADIANGVAILYQLADPGEFLKPSIIAAVRLTAAMHNLPRPEDEYMDIGKDSNFNV